MLQAKSNAETVSHGALIERLRHETAEAHVSLERAMDLAPGRITREQVVDLLTRFYGFYRVWDPWVMRAGLADAFVRPRLKLQLVEDDLQRVGVNDTASLPVAPMTFGAPTMARALGSLYVIEGSTLGSRLINTWIEGAPWLPAAGLGYFQGYGRNTAAMWRQFQEALARLSDVGDQDAAVMAASDTFGALHHWLCPSLRP